MRSLVLCLRGLVFGLFIICNAIICSVAVWHLSLAQMISYNPPVDIYLIFLGAFSLLFIFSVIWIDIVRKNAVTSHVWFECVWAGVFWAMELAGSGALSATVPTIMCSSNAELVAPQSCKSTRVLMAFTWLCMIIMLVYAVTLTVLTIVHQKQSTDVWRTGVRAFCWFGAHEHLESPTGSPTGQSRPRLAAPQPRHTAPPPIFSQFSSGALQAVNNDPSIVNGVPGALPRHVTPPLPAQPTRQQMRSASTGTGALSLYPQHMQKNLSVAVASGQPPAHIPAVRSTSPPPLGEWPRADIMHRPVDSKRKQSHQLKLPRTASQPPAPVPTEPLPQRPRGSRSRSSSGDVHRPPPLDLSNISFFRNIDDRMQNRS